MTDNPIDDDAESARQEQLVASMLGQLGEEDTARLTPPPNVLAAIRAEAGVPVRRANRLTRPWMLAAAALVVLVAGVGLRSLITGSGADDVVTAAALSNAGLSPLAAQSSGQATIRADGQGYSLDLQLNSLPALDNEYFEVWMIDRAVAKMVSLGPYHGNGSYAVPAGYDPTGYPIVDVSIEPVDGQPTHSGVSALRGVLAAGKTKPGPGSTAVRSTG